LTTQPATADTPQSSREFVKAMTLTDATMLVAGSMIGSGIFIVSADISRTVGSPFWLLMAWVMAGVVTILGALAYGELAAMYPRAGGQYVFLRESMGPLMGFLYGWTLFVVIQTGTIAAVAVAFGRFLGVLWPDITPERFGWFPQVDFNTPGGAIQLGLTPQRLVALVTIWILTWINLRGVKEGKMVQTTLTVVKTGALAALILLGLTIGRNPEAIAANFSAGNFNPVAFASVFPIAFGAALVGSLFSADAWNNGRGIQHATQDRVASAFAETIFGPVGASIMAIAILISTFGCNNGLILSGARVYYAMAKDKLFFARAGNLNRNSVPSAALIAQAIWTSLLCLTGTYGQLLDYVIFAALIFYALTTVGLFRLRKLRPDAERPYRALGYPFLPALYIFLATAIAVILLIADKTRAQALSGLVIVLLGVPVYFLWRQAKPASPR